MALVLNLRHGERVHIGDAIVRVQRRSDNSVRLIIDAPPEVKVLRDGVLKRMEAR